MKAMMTVVARVAFSSLLTAQSTMIGRPAEPYATDGVFVLRQFTISSGQGYGTMPQAYAIEARNSLGSLADIAVAGRAGMDGTYAGPASTMLEASEVTYNTLSVLRIRPLLGRDFTAEDMRTGRRLAILSHVTWMKTFGARPDVIGATLRRAGGTAGGDAQIIGVLPPGVFASTPELDPDTDILILSLQLLQSAAGRERTYAPILRLAPGVTVAQAHAAMAPAVAKLSAGTGGEPGTGLRLDTLRRQ